jgi:AraC-like DNA-binding protein
LSPQEYARQQRLLGAKELLDGTFLKVNEVAAQVGFSTQAVSRAISRVFMVICGYVCAPHSGVLAYRHGPDDFLSVHGRVVGRAAKLKILCNMSRYQLCCHAS